MPTTDAGPSTGTTAEEDENVLVLAPPGHGEDYCSRRLFSSHDPVPRNALLVSLDGSPDRRFDAVVRGGPADPSNVALVCCDGTRSAATAETGPGHGPGLTPGPWTATVESPGDLTGLGIRIRQVLSSWADEPEPVELCFHDLEALIAHVEDCAAFRFCHAVTRHVRSTDARSHFHLDPDAVSERTLNTLRPLFDRVEDCRLRATDGD